MILAPGRFVAPPGAAGQGWAASSSHTAEHTPDFSRTSAYIQSPSASFQKSDW